MEIRIANLEKRTEYTAYNEKDCRDDIDLFAFRTCLELLQTISVGIIVAYIPNNCTKC